MSSPHESAPLKEPTPSTVCSPTAASESKPHATGTLEDTGPKCPEEGAPPVWQRYQLIRFHARGGLGEVHIAHDEELNREVALKRIRPENASHESNRQRFLREAEITARLEHPGVVPVHGLIRDADGNPAYAMRFLEGETLLDACRRQHDPGEPTAARRLLARQLLTRFVAVCNTVAYAHNRGILHRDLKPANIMLGAYGETLVVDWGLAKSFRTALNPEPEPEAAAEGTPGKAAATLGDEADDRADAATRLGQVLGTPAYMSPEQAAGRWDIVGPASDVYSLGATLFALLTGHAPFEDSEPRVVLERVQRGDFPRPRQVVREVPPALEAICLRAMALQPEDRYASALALASDVEAWLADEPVTAWREPLSVRARRWVSRHRPLVTGVAAALLALLFSVTLASVFLNRARHEADQAAQRAEAHFQLAREAVDRFTTDVSEHALLNQPGLQPLRESLLETALEFYNRLAEGQAEESLLEIELADAQFRAARLKNHLRREDALPVALTALARQERLASRYPEEKRYQAAVAETRQHLGVLCRRLEQWDEARTHLEEAYRLRESLLQPEEPRTRAALANVTNSLALWFAARNQPKEARVRHEEALALREQLHQSDPANRGYRSGLAQSCNNLGVLRENEGSPKDAAPLYVRARDLLRGLVKEQPRELGLRGDLARYTYNLGNASRASGKSSEAITSYEEARNLLEGLAKENPAVAEYRRQLGDVCTNLGFLHRERGNWAAAILNSSRAVEVRSELAEGAQPGRRARVDLAMACNNLAVWHRDRGEFEAAARLHDRALTVRETLAKETPEDRGARQDVVDSLHNRATVDLDLGATDQALTRLKRAEDMQKKVADERGGKGGSMGLLARIWQTQGIAWGRLGKAEEALGRLKQTLEVRESGKDRPSRERGQACHAYGVACLALGRRKEALEMLEKARTMQGQLRQEAPEAVDAALEEILTLLDLGWARSRNQEQPVAEELLTEAQRRHAEVLARAPELPQARRLMDAYYERLGRLQRILGHGKEAAATARLRQRLWPTDATALLRAAEDLVDLGVTWRERHGTPTAEDRNLSEGWFHEALESVRMAAFHSSRAPEEILKNPRFEPLRKR